MALVLNTNGSQTATITTEHTLATITSVGSFFLLVDLVNMVNGDIVEFRIKNKQAGSGDTARGLGYGIYAHAQGADGAAILSLPIPSLYSVAFTLKQVAGTGRDFLWAIYQY